MTMTAAQFDKLPAAKKRVLIAKDIIALARANALNASHCYMSLDTSTRAGRKFLTARVIDSPAKEQIADLAPHCAVCAKGALYMAHIGRSNRATVHDVIGANETAMAHRLVREDKIFSKSQFNLIECAYEGFDSRYQYEQCFWDDAERIAAIMMNIVKNNGVFRYGLKYMPTMAAVKAALKPRVSSRRRG